MTPWATPETSGVGTVVHARYNHSELMEKPLTHAAACTRRLVMPTPSIRNHCSDPGKPPAARAYVVLGHAHDTCKYLLALFNARVAARGAGATTDEEQDILRSMLVFAAAGLDSTLKYLTPEILRTLAAGDTGVQAALAKFAGRKIRGLGPDSDEDGERSINASFLGQILSAKDPQAALASAMSEEITSHSLQSFKEIAKAMTAMDLDTTTIMAAKSKIDDALHARNNVVHEMDIDFDHPKRNRRTRKRETMVKHANQLLEVAETILLAAANKL